MTIDSSGEGRRQFIPCPACGRLTPGNVVECVECGEPIAALVAAVAEQENEQRFAESIFARATPATWIIIAINLVVFGLMVYAAGNVDPSSPSYEAALLNFGAKLDSAVTAGEYWRLVTPMFLHIGIPHLLVNMYSLYVMGPQVERLFGTSRYVVMYVLAGIGGVLGSYLLDRMLQIGDGVSAGASGALFGLMGVLLVFGLRWRDELPGVFKEVFSPRAFLPVLLLNLVITFAIPFIDKGAHLGGLAVGGLLGVLVPFARPGERRAGFVWQSAASLAVIAVAVSFALAYRTAEPVPDLNRFLVVYNDSNRALGAAGEAVATAADKSAVPASAVDRFRNAAAAVDSAAGLDARSTELLVARRALLERAAELLGDRRSELSDVTAEAYLRDVKADRESWGQWLEQSGPRFRLVKNSEDTTNSGGSDGN